MNFNDPEGRFDVYVGGPVLYPHWHGDETPIGWGGGGGTHPRPMLGTDGPGSGGGEDGRHIAFSATDAIAKAYDAARFIANKRTWSEKCKKTLSDAGVMPKTLSDGIEAAAATQLQLAASAVTFHDGTVSDTMLREAYSGQPDLQKHVDPSQTIGQVFANSPGTGAYRGDGPVTRLRCLDQTVVFQFEWYRECCGGRDARTPAQHHWPHGSRDPDEP